jgi:Uncharacterized conserved protein
MARPTDKESLLAQSSANFEKLTAMVDGFTPEQLAGAFPFEDRDKNVRDVLVHLHEWHLMMQSWYAVGMSGQKPAIPGEGYTWLTLPALNLEIWKKWQGTSLEEARALLAASHGDVMALIAGHSDEELFTKKLYKWTGTTSLGAYFISATASHYDWAMKKLKMYQKAMKG